MNEPAEAKHDDDVSVGTVRVRLLRLDGSTLACGLIPPGRVPMRIVVHAVDTVTGKQEDVPFEATAGRDDQGAVVYEELHPAFLEAEVLFGWNPYPKKRRTQ
jgi:hypothetical protein